MAVTIANPINAGNIVQVRLWCADAEQASVNTFNYFAGGSSGTHGTDDDMAQQLDAIFISLLRPMLYNGCQYRGCTVQLINVTPLPMAASSASGPHSGTGGTIGLPRQVACVGSWRTRLAGPRYRGRVYWPFAPVDADAGDGTPSTGYIADAAALMSALVAFSLAGTAPNTTAVTMVVRSRLPLPGGTTTPINNFVGLSKWGTIKKRGSFGRANSSPI